MSYSARYVAERQKIAARYAEWESMTQRLLRWSDQLAETRIRRRGLPRAHHH